MVSAPLLNCIQITNIVTLIEKHRIFLLIQSGLIRKFGKCVYDLVLSLPSQRVTLKITNF